MTNNKSNNNRRREADLPVNPLSAKVQEQAERMVAGKTPWPEAEDEKNAPEGVDTPKQLV